jgi:hypothetical protein
MGGSSSASLVGATMSVSRAISPGVIQRDSAIEVASADVNPLVSTSVPSTRATKNRSLRSMDGVAVRGSTCRRVHTQGPSSVRSIPTSSRSSRRAASGYDSPGWSPPPGVNHTTRSASGSIHRNSRIRLPGPTRRTRAVGRGRGATPGRVSRCPSRSFGHGRFVTEATVFDRHG